MILQTIYRAEISRDGKYRYTLYRKWDETQSRETLVFCMLNPSTADASKDDPTIRRCRSFAVRQGYGSLTVINLYAYRATKPSDLWKVPDPVGPRNNYMIKFAAFRAKHVVCAWGANAPDERVLEVLEIFEQAGAQAWCLGVTKRGQPRHPLYLPGNACLKKWLS